MGCVCVRMNVLVLGMSGGLQKNEPLEKKQ